jgi:hypothetical protein
MRITMATFLCSLALFLPVVASFALLLPALRDPLIIYVDCTTGKDFGDGSLASPLPSPTAARNYIRSLQPLTSDVTVSITGTCIPSNPDASHNFSLPLLSLSAVDSAPQGFTITYTSSSAVFMGGVPLDDWQPYKGNGFGVALYWLNV